jgi:hypothetical protein
LTAALTFDTSGRTFVEGKCPEIGCTKATTADFTLLPYVEQGTTKEWKIEVKSDAEYFKATIAWMDPTETNLIGTTQALKNDIDLVVIDSEGTTHQPILSSGGTGRDSVNTVEHVSITSGSTIPSGEYTVRVTGTDISSTDETRQPFAIVVTSSFELNDVTNNGGCGGTCAKADDVDTTGMALGIVAVILIIGLVLAAIYFLVSPKLSVFVWGVLRVVVFVTGLVETILLSEHVGDHWRTDGAIGLSIIVLVTSLAIAIVQILGSMKLYGLDGYAYNSRFQMFVAGLDVVLFVLLIVFASAVASSVRTDEAQILVGFVLLIFYAIFVVLFFTNGEYKSDKGTSRGITTGSSGKKKQPPTLKPKPRPKPKTKPKPAKKKKLEKGAKAKAKWSYSPSQSDELALSKGDIVKILSIQGDGWCEGMNMSTYKKGMFPGNYVKVI